MYQYILFDLDGTLTDPGIGITNSVAYALKKWNIEAEDRSELYKFIGPPLLDSFRKYYGFSEEEAVQAIEYYREYFKVTGIYENTMYDGTEELLKKLKQSGKTIVLATSKPQEFAEIILKHFNLDQYFDYVAGATMDGSRSKKADVIAYLLARAGGAENAVMVGDTAYDIIGAAAHGMPGIGVSWGYGKVEDMEAAGAIAIAHSMDELEALLNTL